MSKQPNPPPPKIGLRPEPPPGPPKKAATYPRCATCKHYKPGKNDDYSGECRAITNSHEEPTSDQSTASIHWDGALLCDPDFGCVLHSEIAG